ncbi:putative DEAD-box ATP-dependent RNA helicase 33 [Humulus lupulus]|uniref:putative DEAD-box ATP-dependent RNA helicase 33 n=1 Tax=Humulus lupulus TaxID=3486 RepID=UPI002B4135CC|nr:putative DEAD-box ATP-dependent RNA helicase 33 [Humulus lupulus]
MSLSIQTHLQNLSFSMSLTCPNTMFLKPKFSNLSLQTPKSSIIRMGGGPRTFPGGVSKWQWKRMQAKKAKQLLKARLCRERQIYEMRKRAELKAAVSELERPWEIVERAAPNLFSVSADEQVKVLADRFQKPGGFDMWSEKDGPQLFKTPDELPSARFFPKGVVHSLKPYRRIDELDDGVKSLDDLEDGPSKRFSVKKLSENCENSSNSNKGSLERAEVYGRVEKLNNGGLRKKKGNRRRRFGSDELNGSEQSLDRKQRLQNPNSRRNDYRYSKSKLSESKSEVYDMRLEQDGSYGFQSKNGR